MTAAEPHITYGPIATPPGNTGLPIFYSASQYNGGKPYTMAEWYVVFAPADPDAALRPLRRSEIKAGVDQASVQVANGMITRWEGDIQPHLGGASKDGRSWHCVLQLHGPDYDGVWRGSQPFICVRNGMWRLEHGASKWEPVDIMPYVEAQTVHVDITATMSEKVERGHIKVTLTPLNGTPVTVEVDRFTWEHQYSLWSCGLYRGSGSAANLRPTYGQYVYLKNIKITNSWPTEMPV